LSAMRMFLRRIFLAASCQLVAGSWLWACPRCVDATPYKTGLFWGVLFLMPIPFLLVGGVVLWIVRHSKPEVPKG
ncbi:MAG TPA: hypothetical protein VJ873_03420, partial [bacterium]|nr:hypothetical protein [bacterium]